MKPTQGDPRHSEFIRRYCDAYKARTGNAYLFTGKDAKLVQVLLRGLPGESVDDLMAVVNHAVSSPDSFLRRAANSIPMLVSQWNQIRATMPNVEAGGF